MNCKVIKNINDIYDIKDIYSKFDEITVYTKNIKYDNVLAYAFKYSVWALKKGGILKIKDEPTQGYGNKKGYIDFWQIKYQLFKYINQYIKLDSLDNKNGTIIATKVIQEKLNNGVSFCIVFSGNENEIEYLYKSIDSIVSNTIDENMYEILIVGPSNFNASKIISKYKIKISYFEFDLNTTYRVEITKKKNLLLNSAKFNIVAINHCRIVYSNDFFKKIIHKKFDMTTTRVLYTENNKNYPYLDLALIGSYNISNSNRYKTLVSEYVDDDYLYYMKNRVPYIGGGLTIFNKNSIKTLCYDENIAWGEAEDVDISKMADSLGLLQDIQLDINSYSLTKKYDMRDGWLFNTKLYIVKYLIKKGII